MAEPDRRRRQETWVQVCAGVVFVMLGVVTATWSVLKGIHDADHWRQLQRSGTPLQATVVDVKWGGAHRVTDRIRVNYDYNGRHFDTWTRCPPPTGCRQWPGPQVKIWIDPANPADFVKDSEDSSRWIGIRHEAFFTVFGIAIAAFGVLGTVLGVRVLRRPAAAVAAAAPRRDYKRRGRRSARLPRRRR